MQSIAVGVIGTGRIGRLHAENIIRYVPEMHLKSVCDPYLNKEWADSLNLSATYDNYNPVLQDSNTQAVLICTPAPTHIPIIEAAARAGKHIFCEKPIALSIEEIKHALAVVEESNVKLQIGFNRRFDPNFSKVKHIAQEGEVGAIHLVRITSRDPEPPPPEYIAQSGGIFLDMSIHDFDMARFLAGSEVEEVFATGSVLIDSVFSQYDDIDTAVIQLKFANGALGVIDNSRRAVYGYDQRVEVFGSKGSISAKNNTAIHTQLYTADNVTSEKPLHFFLERYRDSYIAELKNFYESIVNDKPVLVNGMDGLMSIKIAKAAKESYQQNCPVKIS